MEDIKIFHALGKMWTWDLMVSRDTGYARDFSNLQRFPNLQFKKFLLNPHFHSFTWSRAAASCPLSPWGPRPQPQHQLAPRENQIPHPSVQREAIPHPSDHPVWQEWRCRGSEALSPVQAAPAPRKEAGLDNWVAKAACRREAPWQPVPQGQLQS